MGAPADRGAAVLEAVAFATERFLRDEAWQDQVDEVLARLAVGLGVDRAHAFQNVRGPDGRLWMDLRFEWLRDGVGRIFHDPGSHLHPYAPDFARWIELLGSGDVVAGSVQDLPEAEQRILGE